MNKERIEELADIIEALPHVRITETEGFSMENYQHPCGSPACIAGWAAHLWGSGHPGDAHYDAMNALEIGHRRAHQLFIPQGTHGLRHIDPKWAARCLRNLVKTGRVAWMKTKEKSNEPKIS